MARAYTRSFGLAAFNAPGGQVMYTAPPGFQSVIRHVTLANLAGTEAIFSVRSAGQSVYWVRMSLGADSSTQVELRQVLPVNDSIIVDSSSSSWTVAITGYVLTDDTEYVSSLPQLPGRNT